MTNFKETITNSLYGYNPDEFLPVYEGDQLYNKREFIAYKAVKLLERMDHISEAAPAVLGHAAVTTFSAVCKAAEATGHYLDYVANLNN